LTFVCTKLIINKNIEAFKILKRVENLDEELVENIYLFDVFVGDPIPAGKKSISVSITYRSSNETLEDDKINHIHKNITDRLIEDFDASVPVE